MKIYDKKLTAYLLAAVLLFLFVTMTPAAAIGAKAAEPNKKACWISLFDIENLLKDKNEHDFRNAVSAIYDRVVSYGINTVIVHVRPMGDALYPSQYFPWSAYISTHRSAPSYDPLKIMVELAHAKKLKFEAWLNPYRLSFDNKTTASFKATAHYNAFLPYTIEYKGSNGQTALALDPARQEARNLIAGGVREIVSGYAVDGIHFDDYFYVAGMADGLDVVSRKANVNALVAQVYQTVKSVNPKCTFGISPAGNPDAARTQGADIDTWLSTAGYVDYIMPQVYWSDIYVTGGGVQRMFTDRSSAWISLNKLDLPLYIGLGLYRAGEVSKSDLGWSTSNSNLAYQYAAALQLGYDGYSLFRYQWLEKDIAAAELNNLKNLP